MDQTLREDFVARNRSPKITDVMRDRPSKHEIFKNLFRPGGKLIYLHKCFLGHLYIAVTWRVLFQRVEMDW